MSPAAGFVTRDACPACGCSTVRRRIADKQDNVAAVCSQCFTLYTTVAPVHSVFDSTNALTGAQDWEEIDHKRAAYRLALSGIDCVAASPLLDFGCGAGRFVEFARSLRYDAYGFEPSPAQRAKADRSLQARILSKLEPDSRFRLVTMWDVAEHLRDPLQEISSLRSMMADDARLIISVPAAEGALAKLQLAIATPQSLELAEHVQYFSRTGLRKILGRAGFRLQKIRPCPAYIRRLSIREGVRRALWRGFALAGRPMQYMVFATKESR